MTCRRGPHCTARDVQGNPADAPRALCVRDEDELGRTLRAYPDDLVQLRLAALAALPGTGLSEHTAGGAVEAPLPFRADLDELADLLVSTTVEWAWIIASVSGVPGPPPGRHYPGRALQHAVGILRPRMSVLMALQPWTVTRGGEPVDMDGGDAALELFDLHHRVKAVIGVTRKVLHLPNPCPVCGVRALCHFAGENGLRCGSCNAEPELDDVQGVQVQLPGTNTSLAALGDSQWTRETVTQIPGGKRIVREQWTGDPETNPDAAVLDGRVDVVIKDKAGS